MVTSREGSACLRGNWEGRGCYQPGQWSLTECKGGFALLIQLVALHRWRHWLCKWMFDVMCWWRSCRTVLCHAWQVWFNLEVIWLSRHKIVTEGSTSHTYDRHIWCSHWCYFLFHLTPSRCFFLNSGERNLRAWLRFLYLLLFFNSCPYLLPAKIWLTPRKTCQNSFSDLHSTFKTFPHQREWQTD